MTNRRDFLKQSSIVYETKNRSCQTIKLNAYEVRNAISFSSTERNMKKGKVCETFPFGTKKGYC
jgi:hypothetical protein